MDDGVTKVDISNDKVTIPVVGVNRGRGSDGGEDATVYFGSYCQGVYRWWLMWW